MSAVIGFSFTCVNCEKKSEAMPKKSAYVQAAETGKYRRYKSERIQKTARENAQAKRENLRQARPKGRRGKRPDPKKSKQTRNEPTNSHRRNSV